MNSKYSCPPIRQLAACVVLFIAPAIHAGDISGRVSDAAGVYLAGVAVTVGETGQFTTTDTEGRFQIKSVAPGNYTLSAVSIGYGETVESVSVSESGLTLRALVLGRDVVQLGKFLVEGYREGRAKAIQEKRAMANIVDIISADSIGNLPDHNVAEAVSRAPGVNIAQLDLGGDQPQGGEGRYVSIRGIDPNLNQVLLDGNTMAAPGGVKVGRAVPLDVLGASQISSIEVTKTLTPDMDGNSLGGTINVKTASAFARKERFLQANISLNHDELGGKNSPSVQATFGDTFGPDHHWGLAISAAYDKRPYVQERMELTQPLPWTSGGTTFLMGNTLNAREFWGYRMNRGATLNLEYRPSETLQMFVRGTLNQSTTNHNSDQYRIQVANNAPFTLTTPTSGIFAAADTQARYAQLRQDRTQDLTNLSAGLKKTIGNLVLEPVVSYSHAAEGRPRLRRGPAWDAPRGRVGRLAFELQPGDRYARKWEGLDAAWKDPSNFAFTNLHIDDGGITREDTTSARIDARWNLENLFGGKGFLKTGTKVIRRDRSTDLQSFRLLPASSWGLANISDVTLPGVSTFGGRFQTPFRLKEERIMSFVDQNRALTVFDKAGSDSNSIEDDYSIIEDIYSVYGMGNLTFGKVTLLGGLRWERTEATIGAWENRTQNRVSLGYFPVNVRAAAYDTFLPNLQAILRPNKQLVLRGAITKSIGRPAYEDARPLGNFQYTSLGVGALNPAFPNSGTLTIGNPNLKPYKATNYDLSLEWYSQRSGSISMALFRKEIANPIYGFSEVQNNVIHSGIGLETLAVSSQRNAKSGNVDGFELSVYQAFRFLPSPFDGFGVEANLTLIDSEVVVPTRPGENLPFFRQPDQIRNLTFFYEKGRFSGRVAYTYMDGMLTGLASAKINDKWTDPEMRIDAQVRFRINPNYAITVALRNLTREQETYSFGAINGPIREAYNIGRNITVGVNVSY